MKNLKTMCARLAQSRAARGVLLAGVAMGAAQSHAAGGIDLSSLTAAVDFSSVGPAILAVAALKVVPMVYAWASRRVLAFVGR